MYCYPPVALTLFIILVLLLALGLTLVAPSNWTLSQRITFALSSLCWDPLNSYMFRLNSLWYVFMVLDCLIIIGCFANSSRMTLLKTYFPSPPALPCVGHQSPHFLFPLYPLHAKVQDGEGITLPLALRL